MLPLLKNLLILQLLTTFVSTDENVCDGDFNECVPTDQCEEYQDNYSRLKQITNKKSFEFRELRKQLKDSVSRIEKQKKLSQKNVIHTLFFTKPNINAGMQHC